MAHIGTTISSRRLDMLATNNIKDCCHLHMANDSMSKITTAHRRCNWKSSMARGTVAHFQGSMLKAERDKTLARGRRKSKPTLPQGKFSKRIEGPASLT